MDEQLVQSKKGQPTVLIGTSTLHSSFDPVKEAERYIDSLPVKDNVKYFILIEPGLSYTVPALRKIFPGTKVISLHCSSFFKGRGSPDAEWIPGDKSIQSFLEDQIPDEGIRRVKIIEWRPSQEAYGPQYVSLLQEVTDFLKRGSANSITVRAFGPRWIRNSLKNLASLDRVLTFTPGNCPVLVCGAGPGLQDTLPVIKRMRHRGGLFLIAVSSAVMALHAQDIIPDIVIGTDGGNWAKLHFYECSRGNMNSVYIGAALNAALPSQCFSKPILVVSDGSTWQSELLEKSGVPHLRFPQRGTVTASAIDLAFAMTENKVYVSGIDLAQYDLRNHVKPYAFDMLTGENTNRFKPYYSQIFKRIKESGNPGALGIYAAWFKQYLARYPGRIFALGKNHGVFPAMDGRELQAAFPEGPLPEFRIVGMNNNPSSPLETLLGILENEDTGTAVKHELGELIRPGRDDSNDSPDLRNSLISIAGSRYR